MAESFEDKEITAVNTEFIVGECLIAEKLLKEIYSNLKNKPEDELSTTEHCWLTSIEDLYQNRKPTISNKVNWLLQIGRDIINEEKELNKDEKAMVSSFRRVLDVSSKNNSLSTFLTELKNSVEALFRLDYSQKASTPPLFENDKNDLLNYIIMTVDMIRQRLGQSVVSGKVVKIIMGRVTDVGVLVTDEQGVIRFSNDKINELLSLSSDELVGGSIRDVLTKENTLINTPTRFSLTDLEIKQIKVPSVNGEIDEWVYTFSTKVDESLKLERMNEIRTVIEDLTTCDKSDTVRVQVLLEVLRSKFSRIEEVSIPATGLLKAGYNLRLLIDDCLSKVDTEQEGIEIILDAQDNIVYFGNDNELKTIVDQMLSSACQNLSGSPRISKLEIVVSSFQHYLLLAFMDNGVIAANSSLIDEMRENVEKIQGRLELNSGRMGNNLCIILPI